jgi:CubicO group peptidase (beta-lactamase class C family)
MDWTAARRIAADVTAAWSAGENPGGAIIGFDTRGIRLEAFGGFADLSALRPFDRNSVVRFASITKHLTAAVALAAHEQGRIDLARPIAACLPGASDAVGGVRLGRALDMTGGLPDPLDTAWLLGSSRSGLLDPQALVRLGAGAPALNFATGTELSYSNGGYLLLEAVLAARGLHLGAAFQDRFLDPLGITLTTAIDQTEPIGNLAPGYWKSPRGWRLGLFGAPYSGADALAGTPRDLASWLQGLLAGQGPAKGLLQRLSTPGRLADGRSTGMGLGLAQYPLGDTTLVGFGGQMPGYNAQFLLHQDTDTGILVATNREDGNAPAIATGIMARLLSQPLAKPASSELPEGLFATEDGPFWLTYGNGTLAFMGAGAPATVDAGSGCVVGSPYLPLALSQRNGHIVGAAGHVSRCFKPISPGLAADSGWRGRWENAAHGATLDIEVYDGKAEIIRGTGAGRSRCDLLPLGNGRALFQHREGPRTQHVCLEWTDPRTLRLSTNRSRFVPYSRLRGTA